MAGEQKKYRLKPVPVTILLAVLLAGILGGLIWAYNSVNPPSSTPVELPVSSGEPENGSAAGADSSAESAIPEPQSIRVIGVGDDLIHTAIFSQAKKRAGGNGYDFTYAYENVKKLIDLADIASINQETVMVKEQAPSDYPMFNSPTELGDFLVDYGFDVVNLANNHAFDQVPAMGEAAVISYLDFWQTHPEVLTTGVYRNQEDCDNIRTMEKNGVTFAFLGMSELDNGLSLPKNSEALMMRTSDEEKIQQQITKANEMADVVVVNVHWGVEYDITPADSQKALARKMVDWGADIILGHHPHVIQPVEYLEREDGTKAIVAYSLGNFISAQDTGWRMIGGALDVTVTKNFETKKTEITEARFVPLVTQYEGNCANVRNYLLSDYTDLLARSHGVRAGKTPQFSLEWVQNAVNEVIDKSFLTPYM